MLLIRSLPKSASFDESQTALDVVRTKRAKQLMIEKSGGGGGGQSRQAPVSGGARTTKSGLSGERVVGCADLVTEKVMRSKTPTPHHSRPVTPVTSAVSPGHLTMLSPETALPPPPSPPCTCGKVLGDMGPPPGEQDWTDNHSVDSKGTLESRRSQGYVSMNSASSYLIDATGADPVLVPPNVQYLDQYPDNAPMFGYPVDSGLMSHSMTSDRAPLCSSAPVTRDSRLRSHHDSLNKSIIKKVSGFVVINTRTGRNLV